jgi:transposase InsO family protein
MVRRFEEPDGRKWWWQVIIPEEGRTAFLTQVHAGVAGGHFGRRRTELAVQRRAYWPSWTRDVRLAVNTCAACARYLRGKPPRQVPLKPIGCGEPWELLSLDITGPHPPSRQEHRFILTMQDHFTKWAETVPIRRHTAPIVARAVFETIFMRFGAPLRILTDQGAEFESELMAELCRLIGVRKFRTTPYRPQTNGLLERLHSVINRMLAKVISADQRDWAERLPSVMAAYRASVHKSTGFTPNRLILGCETRLPADLVYGLPPDRMSSDFSYDDFVDNLCRNTAADFALVREHLAKAAEIRKNAYDTNVKQIEYNVGQKVWYFRPRRCRNLSPKWQNFYEGSYTVVRLIDSHTVAIRRTRRTRPIVVHRDKLKAVAAIGEVDILCNFDSRERAVPDNADILEAWADEPDSDGDDPRTENQRPRRSTRAPQYLNNYCRSMLVSACSDDITDPDNRREDSPDGNTCLVCQKSFRDSRDLRRHCSTIAHQQVERGREPPSRSRGGLVRASGPSETPIVNGPTCPHGRRASDGCNNGSRRRRPRRE